MLEAFNIIFRCYGYSGLGFRWKDYCEVLMRVILHRIFSTNLWIFNTKTSYTIALKYKTSLYCQYKRHKDNLMLWILFFRISLINIFEFLYYSGPSKLSIYWLARWNIYVARFGKLFVLHCRNKIGISMKGATRCYSLQEEKVINKTKRPWENGSSRNV